VLHILRAGADAAQKVLSLFIEFLDVIADEKLAEPIDREDR
jgi:hypothetical protein